MFNTKVILKIFKKNFLIKLLLLAILYSIIPLSEIWLLFFLGGFIGNYLILGLAALTGLFGVLIVLPEIHILLNRIKQKIRKGEYPGREFVGMAGVLTGAIFLITPGFITDLLGFILFIPFFRNKIGKFLTRRMESRLKDIYEYLKLYEI